MKWIKIQSSLKPAIYEDVLVYVKYEGCDEFVWSKTWLEDQETEKSNFSYKEPMSNMYWAMGSADNYVISHWMRVVSPNTL